MAKTDLSTALSLVKQRSDVRYSNIGQIVEELAQMGFDRETAKMAAMMAFQDGPEVSFLNKRAGVSATQAAKILFESNIDLGDILDSLLDMGFTKDEASNAVDMINIDEGSQTVTQQTDLNPDSTDNAFADYADPGYKYDDLPPQALEELVELAKDDKDAVNPQLIRKVLEKHNVSDQSIGQLNNELFGKQSSYDNQLYSELAKALSLGDRAREEELMEHFWDTQTQDPYAGEKYRRMRDKAPASALEMEDWIQTELNKIPEDRRSSVKTSIEQSWRTLGLKMQELDIPQDQIINVLKQQGASDDEASAAALPRDQEPSGGPEEEGPMGAESMNPEDQDLGGDFPYGADMDMEGPGGLNDGLEGAPGPNDFEATGGGFMGAPEDTEDGQFFTEGQDSGQAPPESGDMGYWKDQGKELVAGDPQMTKTDLQQILKGQGASDEEANQVADELELQEDPAIRPGTVVRAGGVMGEVTGMWDTLYGKMASVQMENGGEYEFSLEDIEKVQQDKLATTRDELFDKISSHLSGDWYDGLDTLPANYRDTYKERMAKARKLQSEVHNRLSTTKDVGEMGMLGEARSALANEIAFCQTRLASADFVGEDAYVNSLPKYEFGKEAALGSGFGPGGGESMVLVAEEMEKEAAAFDWKGFVRIASIEFTSNISPVLIGDAQEVARIASNYISEKVAGLPAEQAQEVASKFLANVEKARRSFAIEKRAISVDGEDLRMRDDWPLNQKNELPDFWTVMNGMTLDSQDEWIKNKVDQLIKNSLEKEDSRLDSQVANGQPVTEEEVEAVQKQIAENVEDSFGEHFNNNQGDMREEIEDYVREWMLQGPYVQNLIEYNHETGEPTYKDRLSSVKKARKRDDNFFDVVEELDDMQDEVEEDEKDKKEKKSFTEAMWEDKWRTASNKEDNSDEGWLL